MNFNYESELIVLSSIFSSEENYEKVLSLLNEKDFYDNKNYKIFQIINSYYIKGQKLDYFRLSQIISEMKLQTQITTDLLDKIMSAYSFAYDLDMQIQLLLELSAKRKLFEMVEVAQKSLSENTKNTSEEVIEMFKRGFDNISDSKQSDENVNLEDVVNEIEEEMKILTTSDSPTTGIQTHLRDLDLKTSGFQRGDLIILAARPSMGKTALSLTLINNMINDNKKAMIFSLEMNASSLLKRMISMESLIPLERIRNGDFDDNAWISFNSATEKMKSFSKQRNFVINDKPGISIEDIHYNAKKVQKKSGLDIIFVDYLQLATTKTKTESRINEVSEISRKLKEIARDLNVPVVALSQLSRAVEQRTNKRPMLSDLRESGAIEQDADVILFLYREQYYKKEIEDSSTEIIIGKQRNGPTDTVRVVFQQERTSFVDYMVT